jgi:tetratricopeptide (TPR) repeat protein
VDCVDSATFAAYFEQRLTPDETRCLFEHVATCVFCAARLRNAATQVSLASADLGRSPTAPGAHPPDAAAPPPRLLGRYQVERVLGVGGMGVVYAAHDPELDRKVAIKLLRPSTRAPVEVLRAQLTREAQAMARLSHPNVINVHEIGAFGEQVFVVMELIDGTTLTEWLRQEPRRWREIVRAFVAAGEGLAAAHAADVIHRDFKPDNVLISKSGRICVTDFGLARIDRDEIEPVANDNDARATGLTYSGRLVGTPGYMAPEQMRGESTDARSDLFSFCVALYEALFGTRPYRGKDLDALRTAMEKGQREPPTRSNGPLIYRRAIERGLDPDPTKRQASMDELLAVLRVDPVARRNGRILTAIAVVSVGLAAFGFQRQRHRTQLCRGAEAQLAGVWDDARKANIKRAFLASGAAFAEPVWHTVEQALDHFAAEWVGMSTEACEATRLRGTQSEQMLERRMRCLDRRLAELRETTTLFAAANANVVKNAPETVAQMSDVVRCSDREALSTEIDPPAGAYKKDVEALRAGLAKVAVFDHAGNIKEAKALLPELLDRAQRVGYLDAEAEARRLAGTLLVRDGEFEKAIATLQQAVAVAERAHDDKIVWDAWRFISFSNMQLGRPQEALVWAENASAVSERMHDKIGQLGMGAMETRLLERVGRADESLALAHRLLPSIDTMEDEAHAFMYRDMIAGAITEMGHAEEALPLFERNLAIGRRLYGSAYFLTRHVYNNKVACLLALERYKEALPDAEEVMGANERIYGHDHPSTGIALINLGEAEEGVGRLAEAREHLERAIAIFDSHSVAGELLVEALTHLGQVQLAMSDEHAAATLERALGVGAAAKLGALLVAPARFAPARTLERRQPERAVALAQQARDAFAQAAASGAGQAPAQRDRVVAWLQARHHD